MRGLGPPVREFEIRMLRSQVIRVMGFPHEYDTRVQIGWNRSQSNTQVPTRSEEHYR